MKGTCKILTVFNHSFFGKHFCKKLETSVKYTDFVSTCLFAMQNLTPVGTDSQNINIRFCLIILHDCIKKTGYT